MTLTRNQKLVYDYLGHYLGVWFSPKQLGRTLRGLADNSNWASPLCLKLVKEGLVERSPKGWYRRPDVPLTAKKEEAAS